MIVNAKAPLFRVGQGIDVHTFQEGRRLVLGGVEIPHAKGLAGHSDADAVIHAVCDAVLGALGLGDIGVHFPSGEARWKDVDSRVLLREVAQRARENGWRVGNVDVTVVAQCPRLAPYVGEMCRRMAGDLGVEAERISVKATTPEGLGALGREEGIAAWAVALLCREEDREKA